MVEQDDVRESDSPLELTDRTILDEELEDLEAFEPSPESVTFATQDNPVDGLVKRLKNGAMLIWQFRRTDERVATAGFQRGFNGVNDVLRDHPSDSVANYAKKDPLKPQLISALDRFVNQERKDSPP